MKATSPADAVGIMMKVFPADGVGIQVISCSVLHLHLLLLWKSCSELLHNTNPASKCQQKLFCSTTDTVGFVCSSGTRDVLDRKRSISDQASTTRGWQNWTLCTNKRLPTHHRRRPGLHSFLLPGVLRRLRLRLLAPFAA
jgi:hypothetical protein